MMEDRIDINGEGDYCFRGSCVDKSVVKLCVDLRYTDVYDFMCCWNDLIVFESMFAHDMIGFGHQRKAMIPQSSILLLEV